MPIRAAEIHPQHWIPDERDGFISWLRGEFAAANAIIDALCQHLQMSGSPGEYDLVVACIQQRRFSWNPILHMQHYYSVAEVLMALQQVTLKKIHHAQASEKLPSSVKFSEFRGSSFQQNKDLREPAKEDSSSKEELLLEDQALSRKVSTLSVAEEAASKLLFALLRAFGIANSFQQVNVLEGLEVYENVADTTELLAAVTQSHIMKSGEGRKRSRSIQFGTIPSEIIAEEQEQELSSMPKEEIVAEGGVPPFLDFLLERVLKLQDIPPDKRPTSCSISVFEPEDFMLLRAYHSFDQPVYMRSVLVDIQKESGNEKRRSLLVLQRNSKELVQCAVSPSQSRQIRLDHRDPLVNRHPQTHWPGYLHLFRASSLDVECHWEQGCFYHQTGSRITPSHRKLMDSNVESHQLSESFHHRAAPGRMASLVSVPGGFPGGAGWVLDSRIRKRYFSLCRRGKGVTYGSSVVIVRADKRSNAPEAEATDKWLKLLPDKKSALYSHSLPCIEAWLKSLGFSQSAEERASWVIERSDWHAQLSLEITELRIRYLKGGPGNLERDIERKFSYALCREDLENAILGGP
ncbi:hypothetical protein SELMODRAFT_443630 [Selaginella moellendorffii]|uniref:Uncharacterized protein n=1 Tax=Selaginella moellendorffii TaxID=88036 RepID=D8S328_SELML|nr:hypothetical protein SELMODRAFT_443630 [Selaginella moellendorffii]